MGRLTDRYYDVTNKKWHWSIKSNSTNDGLVATPQDILDKLAHYEDMEELGRLIEVVRCKDCYHRIERCGMGSHKWCEIWEGTTGENDFCSYGVARTEIEEAESKLEELKGE